MHYTLPGTTLPLFTLGLLVLSNLFYLWAALCLVGAVYFIFRA